MLRTLLVRGMIAGVIAGVLAALFAYLVGEGPVNSAIGFEDAMAAHEGHTEVEIVSRGVQSTLGLLVAVTGYGVAIGGMFALIFAFSLGRIGNALTVRARAVVLAATGFAVVVFVPFLKYPANPPSVGQSNTIDERTVLYFGFVAISVLALMVAVRAWASSRKSFDAFTATAVAGFGYLLLVSLAAWLMPTVDELPQAFPASVLWTFRISSLGTQVVLWGSLGLMFGILAKPALEAEKQAKERALSFAQ